MGKAGDRHSGQNTDTTVVDFLQKDMEGKCVQVSQRPTTTPCHPLENQESYFLRHFPLLLPDSLSSGRKWHPNFRGWEALRLNLLGRMVNSQELLIMSSEVLALVSALWSFEQILFYLWPLSSSSIKCSCWIWWFPNPGFPWPQAFCPYKLMIQITLKGRLHFCLFLYGD